MVPNERNTVLVEEAEILSTKAYDGAQYALRLRSPRVAARGKAGHFVHLRCAPELWLRRPMSIMRANSKHGWIDILFKAHGTGTKLLAERNVGDTLSLIGPIGKPFKQENYCRRPLLIGGGVGIPPIVFLAEHLRERSVSPLIMMGSEVPFPFPVTPSQLLIDGIPNHVTGTMPLMEDWGIPCRLASRQGFAGCFDGFVTELATHWIKFHREEHNEEIEVFACGPTLMLKAVANIARQFNLKCQLSLEEFMACGLGGCAGCPVEVRTSEGVAMKRVCVDGPVFESADIIFA
ncbi:MAG TPA: dihydroorotate dehydrogenase electron transfer subunit [Gammaproteobacteria bacterium]|nr:dihydroorotate dehydrogenase electron transfer subunit [Gammaproteobacteria bacterium]